MSVVVCYLIFFCEWFESSIYITRLGGRFNFVLIVLSNDFVGKDSGYILRLVSCFDGDGYNYGYYLRVLLGSGWKSKAIFPGKKLI